MVWMTGVCVEGVASALQPHRPRQTLLSVIQQSVCFLMKVLWLVTVFLSLRSMWGAEKQNVEMLNCISNFAANLR